ncbi:MAG TPA: transcriptional regulator [Porphyromonadaceae bacterium]|nr:transcriptional regulator [Porphyromonadaceae bacterium]
MKDRIKLIMEKENLTPAKFADRLQINRAVISHILNGRNNPSLDVVTKILDDMHYINPEWLLKGTGSMYKDGFDAGELPVEPDLFRQGAINQSQEAAPVEKSPETALKPSVLMPESAEYKQLEPPKTESKKINQIIIYYSDNTFETFTPPAKYGSDK